MRFKHTTDKLVLAGLVFGQQATNCENEQAKIDSKQTERKSFS